MPWLIFSFHRIPFAPVALALALLFSCNATAALDGDLYENLEPVPGAKAALAEIDPGADFTVFKRVKLLDTFVAFRSGWERDQRRGASRMRISQSEVERIKADVAELFREVMTEALEADDGYEVVDESGDDVLLLRPAVIDLDIVSPDGMGTGRGASFSAETGSATLYIELFDSASNQILGRAADRQTIRNAGNITTWSNQASNRADARRLFTAWAQALRGFLDSHYMDD
jgi:hypothetical protein